MSERKFYAMFYTDGAHTTTGPQGRERIAGSLYAFASETDRDAWVREGWSHPVPRDYEGGHRRAVTKLPLGHTWSSATELFRSPTSSDGWDVVIKERKPTEFEAWEDASFERAERERKERQTK